MLIQSLNFKLTKYIVIILKNLAKRVIGNSLL